MMVARSFLVRCASSCRRTSPYDLACESLTRVFRKVSVSAAITCAYRKSNPGILMVQSTQNWATENASGCLDGA
jgi:hypothetical protein